MLGTKDDLIDTEPIERPKFIEDMNESELASAVIQLKYFLQFDNFLPSFHLIFDFVFVFLFNFSIIKYIYFHLDESASWSYEPWEYLLYERGCSMLEICARAS